ncbi:hypothetical protein AB9F45_37790, partial [Rhizobium leguminosarum]
SLIPVTGMTEQRRAAVSNLPSDWGLVPTASNAFHSECGCPAHTYPSELADGERIVGENLYARHSIGYDDLP